MRPLPRPLARRRLTLQSFLGAVEDAVEAADAGVQLAVDRAAETGAPLEQIEDAAIRGLDALLMLPEPLESLSDAALGALDRYLDRKVEAASDEAARRQRLAKADRRRERLKARAG